MPIGKARIVNLQQSRKDVPSVSSPNESGLLVESEVAVKVGDHLLQRI